MFLFRAASKRRLLAPRKEIDKTFLMEENGDGGGDSATTAAAAAEVVAVDVVVVNVGDGSDNSPKDAERQREFNRCSNDGLFMLGDSNLGGRDS